MRSRRVLLGAAILTGLTVVALVTGAALAGTTPASATTSGLPRVNVDSLYAALAAKDVAPDTSSLEVLVPVRTLSGRVSWYGPGFHGRRTASGERFDQNEMTAAHRSLPFGTLVRVIDNRSGNAVLVRINDRGPYAYGRILDLSKAAARRLGIASRGTATVELEVFHRDADRSSQITFDTVGRAINARGYAVRVARLTDFDEALELQQRLSAEGHENVMITSTRFEGRPEYHVSVGLYSSIRLCRSLMAELADEMGAVTLVRFAKGGPVDALLGDV